MSLVSPSFLLPLRVFLGAFLGAAFTFFFSAIAQPFSLFRQFWAWLVTRFRYENDDSAPRVTNNCRFFGPKNGPQNDSAKAPFSRLVVSRWIMMSAH